MKNMEHFHEMKSLTRKQKFCLLSLIPAYFIVIGLVVQPLQEIVPGIVNIIREPDFLITDYFVVGGVGAALINAGVLTQIGRASCRERCLRLCRSRWSPYH